jgi:hypothetical protein
MEYFIKVYVLTASDVGIFPLSMWKCIGKSQEQIPIRSYNDPKEK